MSFWSRVADPVKMTLSEKVTFEESLLAHYELKIVGMCKISGLPMGGQIIAAFMLIKEILRPLRRIIGDRSNVDRVLVVPELRKVTG
jgi:hypothetical protein